MELNCDGCPSEKIEERYVIQPPFYRAYADQAEGCETCRERRVKCNEIKPICNQCDRLGRLCKWFVGERQPVRVSRRGRGPLKSRPHWIPPPIAPVPSESLIVETDMRSNDPSSPESQWSNSAVANTTSDPNENSDEFHADSGSMDLMISHKVMPNFDDLADLGYSHCFSDVSQQVSNYSPIDQYPSLEFLEIGPSPLLSDFHMALPNSLELSPYEHEALHHYQTTYSLYRTTKDPNWSTHKVLLRMGSYEKMIMHLVLAVSLNDYSIRKGHNASSQEAEDHFRIGAQALVNISSTNLESDEVVTMAAYFFLYLYMSKRKSTRAHQLNQLSLSVLNYVTRHDLFSLCISSNSPSSERSQSKNVSSAHHRSLLARIIMWTLDEDVKCSFQGTGGHFARYLSKYESKTKEIYDTSRNALVDHWGTMYPYSQVLDDDHNSTVLEFLWALMPLWQDINDLAQTSDYSSHRLQIEQTFMRLEEVRSSISLEVETSNFLRNILLYFDTHLKL